MWWIPAIDSTGTDGTLVSLFIFFIFCRYSASIACLYHTHHPTRMIYLSTEYLTMFRSYRSTLVHITNTCVVYTGLCTTQTQVLRGKLRDVKKARIVLVQVLKVVSSRSWEYTFMQTLYKVRVLITNLLADFKFASQFILPFLAVLFGILRMCADFDNIFDTYSVRPIFSTT